MIFKSVVSELYANGMKNEIRKLGKSRGTSDSTMEKDYIIDLN